SQSQFISVAELARHLGLTRMAIFKRIQKGHIKAVKIGRSYAIPRSYLLEDKFRPEKPDNIQYLSVPELAKKLGLSRMAVFLRIKRGEIEAHKVGRHYVIAIVEDPKPQSFQFKKKIQQPQRTDEFLSIPQLADSLGVSRNTVFQKVKKGQIKATRIGRHYSVPKNSILEMKADAEFISPPKDALYLSIAEYARQAGVSRIAIYKRVKKGQLKAIKVGRSYAIPAGEAD
ncbi:MAG: excisionase family DNA-binding protein, partial [Candidatus Omnitrophica bacterium]|nr:excisionase family DNA-binding protein [Candidatus Omnitrophota bacterium]